MMRMQVRFNHLILIGTLFFTTLLFGEGFVAGTLLKAPDGYVAIEELAVGNYVVCRDGDGTNTVGVVTNYHSHEASHVIRLCFEHVVVICAQDQLFYVSKEIGWQEAKNLAVGDAVINCTGEVCIVAAIEVCDELQRIYDITVEDYHNFYVTESELLVHNMLLVAVPAAPAIATALVVTAVKTATIATAAAGFIYSIFWNIKHRNDRVSDKHGTSNGGPQRCVCGHYCQSGCNCGCSCGCGHKIKIFEKNSKHIFRNASGHLSDTPENRQLLLDLVSDSKNFLGVDKHGNHWFARTLPNGSQVWASVRDNCIRNGGINKVIKNFNSETGLSCNL